MLALSFCTLPTKHFGPLGPFPRTKMCQMVGDQPEALPSPPHKYWVIHGKAYDLEAYIAKHPGGRDAILLGRGRDCTELFEQYHVLNNKHLRVLERYRVVLPPAKAALTNLRASVGVPVNGLEDLPRADPAEGALGRVAYQPDPFYEDIKAMAREHGNIKLSKPFVILHCLHVIGLIYSLRLWWQGALMSAFLVPFFLWVFCAAMVHDGGHFALSHSAPVNKWLNLICALVTNSTGCWALQHNILHHSYTNLHGKDGDLDSHHPYMRIHPEQTIPPTTVNHVLRLAGHLSMYTLAHIGLTLVSPVSYFRGLMARSKGQLKDAKVAQDTQTLTQFHGSIVLQVRLGWRAASRLPLWDGPNDSSMRAFTCGNAQAGRRCAVTLGMLGMGSIANAACTAAPSAFSLALGWGRSGTWGQRLLALQEHHAPRLPGHVPELPRILETHQCESRRHPPTLLSAGVHGPVVLRHPLPALLLRPGAAADGHAHHDDEHCVHGEGPKRSALLGVGQGG